VLNMFSGWLVICTVDKSHSTSLLTLVWNPSLSVECQTNVCWLVSGTASGVQDPASPVMSEIQWEADELLFPCMCSKDTASNPKRTSPMKWYNGENRLVKQIKRRNRTEIWFEQLLCCLSSQFSAYLRCLTNVITWRVGDVLCSLNRPSPVKVVFCYDRCVIRTKIYNSIGIVYYMHEGLFAVFTW